MKKLVIFLIVVLVGVVLAAFVVDMTWLKSQLKETVYIKEEVEKEIHPDWAKDEEAVAAAQAVIRKKELQKELESLNAEISVLENKKTEIEKELGTY